jgi:RND superfamily putative drug exporter
MPRPLDRVLPHFDIEGEAVERELALAAWPEPDTTAAVVAESLELVADDRVLFGGADLRVEPGDALVVTGADPVAAKALLLTIAGRIAPTDGRLRVAGHLLPGRGAWVRAHVGVALLADSDDPVAELRRAVRGRAGVVVIDAIDTFISGPVRDRAAAVLRDAPGTTLVLSAADPAAVQALLDDARRAAAPVLDLSSRPIDLSTPAHGDSGRTATPASLSVPTEVNA